MRTGSNRKKPAHVPRKFYALNYRIEAPELRVVNSEGELVGVMPRDEAVKKATELGLDLVLIAPAAKPPVAKITDFRKFLYQEEKKAKEAKKGAKKGGTKEVKLTMFIAEADRTRLIEKAKEFLEDGNQLGINLQMRGREIAKSAMALTNVRTFIAVLGEVTVAKEPRVEGRVVRAVVARKK